MTPSNTKGAYHSKVHDAVIVSMGTGSACKPIWKASRNAIVSKTHPLHASLVQNNSSQVEALVEDSESVAEMAEWWKLLSNTTAAKEAGLPTITAIQRAYLKAAAATTVRH